MLDIEARYSYQYNIEVCTGPGLYPAQPVDRARPADESWFFQWIGRGQQMKDDFFQWAGTWEVIFRTGWAGPAKRELSFLTAESDYKKRKANNIASQFKLRKQTQSFETDR